MAKFIKTKSGSVTEQMKSYIVSRNVLILIGFLLFFAFKPFIIIGLLSAAYMQSKINGIKIESQIEKKIVKELSRLSDDYDIFKNLFLEYSGGMLVQVKYLIIGVNKLFIIGTLRGSGNISGSIKSAVLLHDNGDLKENIPNPFQENKSVAFGLNVLLAKLNISRDPIQIVIKEDEKLNYFIEGLIDSPICIDDLADFIFDNDAKGFWITPDERKAIISALKGLST